MITPVASYLRFFDNLPRCLGERRPVTLPGKRFLTHFISTRSYRPCWPFESAE